MPDECDTTLSSICLDSLRDIQAARAKNKKLNKSTPWKTNKDCENEPVAIDACVKALHQEEMLTLNDEEFDDDHHYDEHYDEFYDETALDHPVSDGTNDIRT